MQLDEIDKVGLIREAYAIDGIVPAECRSIFFDWALKLPDGVDQRAAIEALLSYYGAPDHPMTEVLKDGLGAPAKAGRRGGRAARVKSH